MSGTTESGALLLRITFAELSTTLDVRQAHHQKRAEELFTEAETHRQKNADRLGDANSVSDRLDIKGSTGYRNDESAEDSLRRRAIEHAKQATRLKYYRDHLDSNVAEFHLHTSVVDQLELISTTT